jgi:hypothetical protein
VYLEGEEYKLQLSCFLINGGFINAESNAVDGGNINLNSHLLLLRRNSSISALLVLLKVAEMVATLI